MVRFKVVRFHLMFILLILISTSICFSTYSSSSPYYWLKPGVFFKYKFMTSIPRNIVINDKVNGIKYIADPINSSIFFYWKVVDIIKEYILVEIKIVATNVLNEETNLLANYSFSYKFLVDKHTLDTYNITHDGRRGVWVGEWPYLLQPIFSSEEGVKLIYIFDSPTCMALNKTMYNLVLRDVERINKIVYKVSNGTKIFSLTSLNTDVTINGSLKEYYLYCIGSKSAVFTIIHPPPAQLSYNLSGIILGPERIASSEKMKGIILGKSILNSLLNPNYNSSERGLIIDHLLNFTVLIDPWGNVYSVMLKQIPIIYDSLTGILLKASSSGFIAWNVLPFLCLRERIDITFRSLFPDDYKRARFIIELVETNISFYRPVIGGVETRSEELVLYMPSHVYWTIILGLIIFIALAIIFYWKRKR